jgi:AcrR family transcriptional regulator
MATGTWPQFVRFRTTGSRFKRFGTPPARLSGNEADMTKPQKKTRDRRVQRTRKLLQDGLIAMMIEKGYEATTVQNIIDRADVGRATFYAHFADKQALLLSSFVDLRAHLLERQQRALAAPGSPDTRSLGFSLAMLEHARGHLPLWTAIAGRESGAFVLQRIRDIIAELAGIDLAALDFKGTPEQRALAAQYVAGAFMSVLSWWLDQGARLPPPEVDTIFRRLVMQGLARELRLRSPGG